ncbi:hypothetical protein [Prosthecobacter sp.]|uniref:SLOG cluster 4 domain-containing protein n=1 Tax=Prosthecobacter sp. TaxID=1965333 RepID=UPI00378316EB
MSTSHPSIDSTCARNMATGAQIRIGVMGSAAEISDSEIIKQCRSLGRAIAEQGCCVLTGACPGMPHEVVLGAKEMGGNSMGISPAVHLREHIGTFTSPYKEYDVMVYTGLGLMGRELINIRSSDIILLVGGRCGTLGEFAIAYEEGKLIGVLTGTGGITNVLPQLVDTLSKQTGSEVIYDADPQKLVARLLQRFQSPDYECTCKPESCCRGSEAAPHECCAKQVHQPLPRVNS